jgi:uncharacterized protein (TIGR02996 family)
MSERDALFAAILADPADDVSRLVFADWLEETARPIAVARARFIRLQIELARGVPDDQFPHRAAEITTALAALAARWARAWLAELPPRAAKAAWAQRLGARAFRRGFVDGVTLPADVFRQAAPVLFDTLPLTELHLHGAARDVTALLAGPHLRRLRAVRLSGNWPGDRLVRRLAKCPDLGAVRELDLSRCRLTDTGALDLVRAPALEKLTSLRLAWNRLGVFGLDELATAPGIAALARLDVTGNPGTRLWTAYTRARYGPRLLF